MIEDVIVEPASTAHAEVTATKAFAVVDRISGGRAARKQLLDIVAKYAPEGRAGEMSYSLDSIDLDRESPPVLGVTLTLRVPDAEAARRIWQDVDRAFEAYLDGLPLERRADLNLRIGFRVVASADSIG